MQKLKIMIYMALITYLVVSVEKLIKMRGAKDRIEDLESSNKRLQNNYDNVRAFKHDFNNIMQSIGGYIALNDMEGLKAMYKSIVKECQEINNSQSINESVINNPAVYHLINYKYEEAKKYEIEMEVKVLINLQRLKVGNLDLCRILGILIDNAIEAARECDEKYISIKFVNDVINNRYLIIVENTYKNSLIDINKIFEKGFSSKKKKLNHGLGLWKVRQILRRNNNIKITTIREKLFKQQLEIY